MRGKGVRRRRNSPLRLVLGATVLVAAAAIGWFAYRGGGQTVQATFQAPAPAATAASPVPEHGEPANAGRDVKLAGKLSASASPRDAELGISAAAALLMRNVEMYQWRERCEGSACSYETVWSSQPIDSRKFREPRGHDNPPQRLVSRRFDAQDIRIGTVEIDPEVLAAQVAAVEYPVHAAMLPANLAASFSDAGGVLYAGGDPAHPKAGELRVSYRVVPLAEVSLHGVQQGSRLTAK